jgi:fatty-acyl-CoA synthase
MALSRWIERHAAWQPTKPALIADGRTISYQEFAARIDALASGLVRLGLTRGDRIAILAYNRPEYLELVFAAARIGAIVVPLNWRLAPPEHQSIVGDAAIAALVCEAKLRGAAQAIGAPLESVRRIAIGFAAEGWTEYEALLAEVRSDGGGLPDDPALIVYTSGTTGKPKGAVLTQNALAWNAVNGVAAHDMAAADRILTNLPLFHVGGLNNQTLPAFHAGATVLLQRRFAPGEMLAAIARDQPSIILLVPAVMSALIGHPAWQSTDLSSVRLAMAGSSVVPVDLIRAFHARGVPVGQIYGSTETAPIAAVLRREDALRKAGSAGTAALHCDVRIVDERGRDVARGARGEILVRGPNVMRGYWRNETATRAAFHGGWFRTGDIGALDDDGYLFVVDRKQDMIVSGGENIYPAELEALLSGHHAIAEAAVVGCPDRRWGEAPVAFVVRAPGSALDENAVKALFDGQLARFKHPQRVIFVDGLPRNAMGKILRYELRKRLAE